MSVLYVAGIFGLLLPASWIVFLTGLAYLAKHLARQYTASGIPTAGFSWYLNTNRIRELFPLAFFGILYFLNWIIFRNGMFSLWDEWSIWGLFTKILTNYDSLSTRVYDQIGIGHLSYPKITSILQYYFILFLNNGEFHEGTAIFAQTVIISSAVPAFLYFRKDRILLLFPSFFAFYCIIHLFHVSGIYAYSMLADTILGLCWGMSVVLYLSNRNRPQYLIITSLALFPIVQIKDTGVLYSFSTILVIAMDRMIFHTSGLPVKLKQVGTLIAVVMISWASWNMFKQYNEIEAANYSNLPVQAVNAIKEILSDPQDYQRTTAANWLHSMTYAGNVNEIRADMREAENNFIAGFGPTFAFSNFSLSPLYWLIIYSIFAFSLYSAHAGSTGTRIESKNVYLTAAISLAVLVVIHACFILFMYMFRFSTYEAVRLASFDRYIGTAFLGIFLVMFYLTLEAQGKIRIMAFFILIFLFMPVTALEYFLLKDKNDYIQVNDIYKRIDPILNEIKEGDPESRILFVNQGGNGTIYVISKYRAFPMNLEIAGGSSGYSVSTTYRKDWEPWLWVASQEDFGRTLSNVDYLVVWNDTEFFEMYGDAVERSKLKAVWRPATDGRLEKYVLP